MTTTRGGGFLGDPLGTATLILLGDGVVASVLLAKSKGENSGWIVITADWGFGVLCGVLIANAAGGEGFGYAVARFSARTRNDGITPAM